MKFIEVTTQQALFCLVYLMLIVTLLELFFTGIPLIDATYHENGNLTSVKYDSKAIFGNYIHKYYCNQSIADYYTLRLICYGILTTYKESLQVTLQGLKVQKRSY